MNIELQNVTDMTGLFMRTVSPLLVLYLFVFDILSV